MPLREYTCARGCEWGVEILEPQEKKPRRCGVCGGRVKEVVPRPGGFDLRGAGFFKNDYGAKPPTEG